MKIQYIPLSHKKPRCGLQNIIEYITIHSTGNPDSTAQNEADYVCYNSDRSASYHYVVDDKQVIKVLPDCEIAYHSGTTKGNKKSIAIEICEGGNRVKAVNRAVVLTKTLMKQYNIPIDRVVTHYFWNGKNCPRILIDNRYIKNGISWEIFKKMLEGENVKIYNSIDDLTGDFKTAVKWALDNKILFGRGNGLGLTETEVKCLVFLWRFSRTK